MLQLARLLQLPSFAARSCCLFVVLSIDRRNDFFRVCDSRSWRECTHSVIWHGRNAENFFFDRMKLHKSYSTIRALIFICEFITGPFDKKSTYYFFFSKTRLINKHYNQIQNNLFKLSELLLPLSLFTHPSFSICAWGFYDLKCVFPSR